LDLPVEIISATRAAEIDPGITMDIIGAVFYPLDAHLDPRLLMRKLTELVTAASITIHWSTQLDAGERAADASLPSRLHKAKSLRTSSCSLRARGLRSSCVRWGADCCSRAARATASRCPIQRRCHGSARS